MSTILFNKNNHSVIGGKSVLTYQLTTDANTKTGYEIGLSECHIYNSFFNIKNEYNNNKITIMWLGVQYNFTLPDGYYTIDDLNLFIEGKCFVNHLYLIDNIGKLQYFIEIKINPVRYGSEVNLYAIPNVLPTGYTKPSGASWNLPTSAVTPQIYFNANFGKLIGFSGNRNYPTTVSATSVSFDSDVVPEIHTVSSLIVCCNVVANDKFKSTNSRNDILFTMPINSDFGSQLTKNNTEIVFNNVSQTQQNRIELSFYDQLFRPINILDPDLVIVLVIKEKQANITDALVSLLKPQVKGNLVRYNNSF
jgi:hypothetical protein